VGDLTKNFSREEFACKCCCGLDTVDWELVDKLQRLRDVVGVPIAISSGARCDAHNATIGGSPTSQHLVGKAADCHFPDYVNLESVYGIAKQIGFRGIGRYPEFLHLDVRAVPAEWSGT